MNIQNNRAAEVLYSTTYVEDYLDTVENLPDEVQRLLSRLTVLDSEGKTYFDKVRDYFAQLVTLKQRSRRSDSDQLGLEIGRIHSNITLTLIKAQEIGDQKIQVAQQIQDFVDNRLRQLEVDRKTLDSVQKQADAAEAASSSTYSARGDREREREAHPRLGSIDSSASSERGVKRVRRVRLGPSIIPNKPTSASASTPHTTSASSSSEKHRAPEASSSSQEATSLAAIPVPAPTVEKEQPKEKVKKEPSNASSTPTVQESRRDSTASSSLPAKKRPSISEPEAIPVPEASKVKVEEAPTERRTEHLLRTPKKKEKKVVLPPQKQERKSSSASSSSATKRTAAKRKAAQDGALAGADPDEATYCICVQISYGDMIGCDNDLCPIEWFHFSCVQLSAKPKGKWYCPSCRDGKANVMKPKEVFLKELEQYNREREGR